MSTNLDLTFHAAAEAPSLPVVDIRYGQVGLVQVRIRSTDPGAILDELTGRIATAPHFFLRTAVCLDLGTLAEIARRWPRFEAAIDAIRRAGMLAIGLAGSATRLEGLSKALNLPILSGFRTPSSAVPTVQPVQPAAEAVALWCRPPAPRLQGRQPPRPHARRQWSQRRRPRQR